MLRTSRPLLAAATGSLAKRPASIATLTTSTKRISILATKRRPQVPSKSASPQLTPLLQQAQLASNSQRDVGLENELAQQKLKKDPEHVTAKSSVRAALEGVTPKPYDDASTTEGVKRDLSRLKETLALGSVPPLSYQLGLAGTIPYLATSLSTVFLSWNLNAQWPSQSQFLNHIMFTHEDASYYLHLLEPIQVGYGAVIISFLGAIHWGLEYAEKHPEAARTRFRYGMGVLAPMLAWPTMALPVQFALTAQFAAFTAMYFFDARATTKGWTPQWYGTYRFVLTFIVGSAILVSLIGREKIGADQPRLTGLREKFHKEGHDTLAEHEWEELEKKELEKNRKKKAAAERKKEAEAKAKEAEEEEKKIEDEANKPSKGKSGDKKKDEGKEAKSDGKNGDKKKDEGKEANSDGKSEDKKKDEGKKAKSDEKSDDEKEYKDKDQKEEKKDVKNENKKDGEKEDGDKEKGGDDKKQDNKSE